MKPVVGPPSLSVTPWSFRLRAGGASPGQVGVAGAIVLMAFSAPQKTPAPERPPVADFRDVSAAAGLTARTVIGGERSKEFILETTGGGVAIIDYDNDGWPDIFLVNGARLSTSPADAAPV